MIKINLAKRRNVGAAAVEGGGAKFNLDRLGVRWEDLKELPLKTLVVCILVAYFSTGAVEDFKHDKLSEKDRDIKVQQDKQEKLSKELAKTKDYDIQKKQLEADESTLRGKIDAIQKLISDRMALYNGMVAMSSSIPTGVWLRDFAITGDLVTFGGSSVDISQVSDFMKRLGESPHYKDINLRSTTQSRDAANGSDILNFDLTAKRR